MKKRQIINEKKAKKYLSGIQPSAERRKTHERRSYEVNNQHIRRRKPDTPSKRNCGISQSHNAASRLLLLPSAACSKNYEKLIISIILRKVGR